MSDDLEVVILNDQASITGGSTAVAVASALELAARGIRVTFFAAVGPVAPELRQVPNLSVVCLDQLEIARDRNRIRAFVGGLWNAAAVRELQRVLAGSEGRRVVVHAHSWTKALSPFVFAVATQRGIPLVITLHDFFIACPNGGLFDYNTHTLCMRVPLSASCWRCSCDRRRYAHKLWRGARTTIQNRLLRVPQRTAHFIGVSQFSLDRVQQFLPADVPATVIRNPVDAIRGEPVDVTTNKSFVYVGRLEVEKGAKVFAEAVRASGVHAKFIGDGALATEVRQICPNAEVTGWLKPEQIREHLRQARCLVFPPLWYETLGLVVVEAAAMGVPAIVADQSAATDYISDGVNGRHFAHGSTESLARIMKELESDDQTAARLGRSAYEWYWREPWTPQRHVDELLDVYGNITCAAPTRSNERRAYGSTDRIRAGSGRCISLRGDTMSVSEQPRSRRSSRLLGSARQ